MKHTLADTVGIIFSTLLRIGEDLMGSLDGLEFRVELQLFAGVTIRMILESKFFELLLDLDRIRRGKKFEVGIVVAFRVCLHHLWASATTGATLDTP